MSMLSNLELLMRVPLFSMLTGEQANLVAQAVSKRRVKRGEVVLEQGRVVQTGTPAEIASRPATPYVARLMGLNLYAGNAGPDGVVLSGGGRLDVADRPGTGAVLVSLRPSAITVHLARPEGASHRNVWPATVDRMEVLGDRVRLHVTGEPDALVDVTPASVAELGLAPGVRVWLSAKATEATAYAR